MRKLALYGTSLLALVGIAGTAIAQAPTVKVGDTGLIVAKNVPNATAVVQEKPKLRGIQVGATCKLHDGDTFTIVGVLEGGDVLVTRSPHVRFTKADKQTCPSGVALRVTKAIAESAVLAKQAADAAKAKPAPKKS